jgi:hypothetical protein
MSVAYFEGQRREMIAAIRVKDVNGRIKTKEIMQVLFSLLEGPDEPAFRAS